MEDGLGEIKMSYKQDDSLCLNPCCNGRWSRSIYAINNFILAIVLILVVMEDGLGAEDGAQTRDPQLGLNPCCNGRWSRS